MEEPPKCTIFRLNIQNFLGVTPLKMVWKSPQNPGPKMHHFKVKISKFPGGAQNKTPDPPIYPLQMV